MKKTKTIFLFILLFIVMNSIVYIIGALNEKQRVQVALNTHLKQIKTQYKILLYHQQITANAAYQSTINIKKVITILSKVEKADTKERAKLRQQLFKILQKKYKILKSKGVLQYHFVLPNNIVFLRMHKPTKFGDDLSKVRYSFSYTNRTHKQIHGFEQGRTTHGFRNVYPIFDENKHYLGALDIAFSSEFLQNYLTNIGKIHTHFLVKKKVFTVKAWKRDDMIFKYIQSQEHPDYMMSLINGSKTKKHLIDNFQRLSILKNKIYKNMNNKKPFSLNTMDKKKKKSIVISFYPIKNIKDKEVVAWIVAYTYDSFIDMTLKIDFYMRTVSFFIFLILFYFAYRVFNQKEILDIKVQKKTKELAKSKAELQYLNENLKITVTNEVHKNQEKDRLLFQQSKMASMGEMIGNIAHQWRQPIAVISMWANNIIADIDMDEIEKKNLKKYATNINLQTKYLSQTIDDFRNFFSPNKEKSKFTLKNSINKTMNLLSASFKSHNITVIQEIEDIEVVTLENELTQAILNIIKNAKDVLVLSLKDKTKLIFIKIYLKNNFIIIEIIDNGGGIPNDIIDKVFEPYFTTKHKSQGTGIGLYMTESIVTKHLNGQISVENYSYQYKNKNYIGAKFMIKLPL